MIACNICGAPLFGPAPQTGIIDGEPVYCTSPTHAPPTDLRRATEVLIEVARGIPAEPAEGAMADWFYGELAPAIERARAVLASEPATDFARLRMSDRLAASIERFLDASGWGRGASAQQQSPEPQPEPEPPEPQPEEPEPEPPPDKPWRGKKYRFVFGPPGSFIDTVEPPKVEPPPEAGYWMVKFPGHPWERYRFPNS